MMSSDSSGWDQIDWNHVVSFLLRQVVYVEGLTAEGTSEKFKTHVLFIFAGPPLEIKKGLVLSFRPSQSNRIGQIISLKPGAGAEPLNPHEFEKHSK